MHYANLPLGIPEYKGVGVIEWKSFLYGDGVATD
jgi:hypothetical protein